MLYLQWITESWQKTLVLVSIVQFFVQLGEILIAGHPGMNPND